MVGGSDKIIAADICSPDKCCGCAACVNICPVKCLVMKEDKTGELHPYIDASKCISCGLCNRVCQNTQEVVSFEPKAVYAGWRKNTKERVDSSSGGLAAVLSEFMILKGEVVCGALFKRDKGVIIKAARTAEEIKKFKGSKYVQASLELCYSEIENYINMKKKVLLFGTPCQIVAIKKYLEIRNVPYLGKLFTVDFLCHGVAPGKYLLDEIDSIEKKIGCKIDNVSFRSNDINYNYYFCLHKNGKVVYKKKATEQRYFYGFLKSIINRDSCISCKFKCPERVADLTLGDFIGLGSKIPFVWPEDVCNVSLVLVNTFQGQEMINCILEDVILEPRTLYEAIEGGPSLRGGTGETKERKKFKKLYLKHGYDKALSKVAKKAIFYERLVCFLITKAKKVKNILLITNRRVFKS